MVIQDIKSFVFWKSCFGLTCMDFSSENRAIESIQFISEVHFADI